MRPLASKARPWTSLHELNTKPSSDDPAEADIVRRIFREYAAGKGPLAIVRDLNREGVPGPTSRHWNA